MAKVRPFVIQMEPSDSGNSDDRLHPEGKGSLLGMLCTAPEELLANNRFTDEVLPAPLMCAKASFPSPEKILSIRFSDAIGCRDQARELHPPRLI